MMKKQPETVILLLFMFLIECTRMCGANFSYINLDDGLSSQRVYAIKKGHNDYMWFATRMGIDRYNGMDIKHYSISKNGKEILDNINILEIDSSRTIWGACLVNDVFVLDYVSDEFTLVLSLNAGRTSEEKDVAINSIYFDSDDKLWICTDEGLYLYHSTTALLQHFYEGDNVTAIVEGEDNIYYVGKEGALSSFVLSNNTLVDDKLLASTLDYSVNKLYYDQENAQLYVGSDFKGLFVYRVAEQRLEHIPLGFTDVKITEIVAYKQGEILVATNGVGLHRLRSSDGAVLEILSANRSEKGIKSNAIYSCFIDESYRIWLATYPNGITVYSPQLPSFRTQKHLAGNPNSLVEPHVNCVKEDSDGDLWYATDDGISCFCVKNGQWKHFLSSELHKDSLLNCKFYVIEEVEKGIFWAGGNRTGLYAIDKQTGKASYMKRVNARIELTELNNQNKTICRASDGMIWWGGNVNVKCMDPVTDRIQVYAIPNVSHIKEKNKYTMLIGTFSGLYELDKQTGKISPVHDYEGSLEVLSILISPDSTLYLGTDGAGLVIYNYKTKERKNYLKENSALLSNTIFQVVPYGDNGLFLSTEAGIAYYNKKKETFSNWTSEHGLARENFNAASGIRKRNGSVVFGSSDGTIEFDPEWMIPHDYQSKLVFDMFELNYQRVNAGKEDAPIDAPIDKVDHIVLQHMQNNFAFHFSSINYEYAGDVTYSWRLKGFYDQWTQPTSLRQARYTNLDPGHYVFQVKALAREDNRLIEQRDIAIDILPPFWATWWAYLIYCGILIVVVWGCVRMIFSYKERKMSERKIDFFINTAHDLRTPLTLIKVPLDEIAENEALPEHLQNTMQLAVKNANILLRMVSNLLNFEKVEQSSITLNTNSIELKQYLLALIDDYKLLAAQKKIKLVLECTFESLVVKMDREKMDVILKNLLSNAFKYTPERGTVVVTAWEQRHAWGIDVSDDGIGIPKEDQKKLFKRFYRARNAANSVVTGSGIGLLLVKKLVQIHRGKISVSSAVGDGTTFSMKFHTSKKKKNIPITDKPSGPYVYLAETAEKGLEEITDKRVAEPEIVADDNQRHKLLIVEDNNDLREFLRDYLNDYEVYVAENGEEALKEVEQIYPDLILSDVLMPVMDGNELCRRIKNNINTSHIPVILLTALDDRESTIYSLKAGADDYITKPFEGKVLKARIETLLRNRRILLNRIDGQTVPPGELPPNGINRLDEELMRNVDKYIERNIGNSDYTIDALCADVAMSRTALYHKVKTLTTDTPSEYIRRKRLDKAVELLKRNYPVSEVASMTGFCDMKHFRIIFKKRFGVNPSEYRSTPSPDEKKEATDDI